MKYDFLCESCNIIYEVQIAVSEYDHFKTIAECPKCGGSLSRELNPPFHIHVVEIKTVGQLMDANSKKMGRGGVQEQDRKMRQDLKDRSDRRKQAILEKFPDTKFPEAPKDVPDWAKPDMSLAKMTPRQQERYIYEGKK